MSRLHIEARDLEAFAKVLGTGERCFPVMGKQGKGRETKVDRSVRHLTYHTLVRLEAPPASAALVTLTEELDTPARSAKSLTSLDTYRTYDSDRTGDDTIGVETSRSKAMRALKGLGVSDEQLQGLTTVKVKTLRSFLQVQEGEDREVTTVEDERVPSRWSFEVDSPLRIIRCTVCLEGTSLRFVIDVPDLEARRQEEIDRRLATLEELLGEPVLAGTISG